MRQWFHTQSGGAWERHIQNLSKRLWCGALVFSSLAVPSLSWSDESPVLREQIVAGEELFLREWTVGDKRSVAGDGLGPMYNAASCVKCHRLGGVGGGGTNEENVDLLTVVAPRTSAGRKALTDRLGDFHPALVAGGRRSATTVLHRFSPDPSYEAWRQRIVAGDQPPTDEVLTLIGAVVERGGKPATSLRRLDGVGYRPTQRNTPALFGAGLIDALPDAVWEELEARQTAAGEVSGRVPRAAGGNVGRFGWRGQTSTLHEFVLGACAVELGLQAPGHPQPMDPLLATTDQEANQRPKPDDALDIDDEQCRALSEYVAHLPSPARVLPSDPAAAETAARGEERFTQIGCAACHVRQVAEVSGIYSDLLLHDMGKGMEDPVPANPPGRSNSSGSYYGGVDTLFATVAPELRREWRTPPLWGIRDSAPYLHDGRAQSLSEAVGWHGGEAAQSARKFQNLTKPAQEDVLFFLSCLAAPSAASLQLESMISLAERAQR
ncbi:MAG TPA: di-heme oxidoredictase family protein [Pirellulales bacterium]|nr:di-heme oxidoredictase family protein [Pirellulales bacterium]